LAVFADPAAVYGEVKAGDLLPAVGVFDLGISAEASEKCAIVHVWIWVEVKKLVCFAVQAWPRGVVAQFGGHVRIDIDAHVSRQIEESNNCVSDFILDGVFDLVTKKADERGHFEGGHANGLINVGGFGCASVAMRFHRLGNFGNDQHAPIGKGGGVVVKSAFDVARMDALGKFSQVHGLGD
jgi:hypothetical protein